MQFPAVGVPAKRSIQDLVKMWRTIRNIKHIFDKVDAFDVIFEEQLQIPTVPKLLVVIKSTAEPCFLLKNNIC